MGIKENKMDENIPLKLAISVLLFTGMVLSSIFPYGALANTECTFVGLFASEFFATIAIIFTLGPLKVWIDI